MTLAHQVEQRGAVVQVNPRAHAAAAKGLQADGNRSNRRPSPREQFAQRLLKDGGKRLAGCGRVLPGSVKSLTVDPDGGAHAPKHVCIAPTCLGARTGQQQGLLGD